MANRVFPFAAYSTEGGLYTETTAPTVTVQYGSSAPSGITATKRGNGWSVEIDEDQDALLIISGTGIITEGKEILRRQLPVPPTTEQIWSAVERTLTDKAGFSLVADYDPAKTAASPAEVATALTTYGAAKLSDIPTDYALESTLEATQSAVETLNDFDPATDTVATVQTVVEPVTASVDVSGIPTAVWTHDTRTLTSATGGGATAEEVWAYADRTLTDDIPTETADLLGERHGVGMWGAADPSWPAITSATLDDDGVALGPLDSADVLIVAQADGSSYGTRSDGDGEFELRVPSGATYTLQALRPGFAYPIRTVTV